MLKALPEQPLNAASALPAPDPVADGRRLEEGGLGGRLGGGVGGVGGGGHLGRHGGHLRGWLGGGSRQATGVVDNVAGFSGGGFDFSVVDE